MISKKIKNLILLYIILFSSYLLGQKFQVKTIKNIVQQSMKLAEKERLNFILKELNQEYQTTISPKYHLFNGGGAFGVLGVLYSSLTEYLIVYGSPLSNGGHSGRYLLNIHDFIYRGKVKIVTPQNLEGEEVHAGEHTFLPWGQSNHYRLYKDTWMIEYGYGFTPSALPFMILGIACTGDMIGSSFLFYDYGKGVLQNFINSISAIKANNNKQLKS